MGLANDRGLAVLARRAVVGLARAVVVGCRSFDDRMNVVTVLESGLEEFEHDDPDAAAGNSPARAGVEGADVPIGRDDTPRFVHITLDMPRANGDPAGEGEIALAGEQPLTRKMNRDEGGRARGLNRVARTPKGSICRRRESRGSPCRCRSGSEGTWK